MAMDEASVKDLKGCVSSLHWNWLLAECLEALRPEPAHRRCFPAEVSALLLFPDATQQLPNLAPGGPLNLLRKQDFVEVLLKPLRSLQPVKYGCSGCSVPGLGLTVFEAPSKKRVSNTFYLIAALLESGDAASYGAAGGAGRKMWSWKFGSPFAALSGWSLSAPLVAECFGTGCLVFTVGCLVTGPAPQAWVPTSIAFVLMVMIYATGSISGGNLNPAVSLSLAICGKLPWNKMLTYWMVQLVGGFIGSALFRLVCSPGYVIVAPIKPFGAGSCFCAELIYTTLLCFTVLSCAASRRNNPKDDPNQFYALAIGFTIIAGGHAVGSVEVAF
ncbi:putative aquaporin NIP4-2 [Symbiodinium microadriaticum]|uniref:Putative aquaporin NIP4-2 n=1 Tax=Symbiodinium microadriaticum TaxID=2951 RepID=A0A1Q9CDX6_SYMMI|nr:putative aquaporin NIP4-2 [Symbiodinium microadriaticum]